MTTSYLFQYDLEGLQNEFDHVKDAILANMVNEKIIPVSTATEYSKTHTVILKEPSSISSFFSKFFKKDEKRNLRIFVAKISSEYIDENEVKEEK